MDIEKAIKAIAEIFERVYNLFVPPACGGVFHDFGCQDCHDYERCEAVHRLAEAIEELNAVIADSADAGGQEVGECL